MADHNKLENFLYWPLDVLNENLLMRQENFIKHEIPAISDLFQRTYKPISDPHPTVSALYEVLADISARLENLFLADAARLFPYVKQLVECHQLNLELAVPEFSSLYKIHEDARRTYTDLLDSFSELIHLLGVVRPFAEDDTKHRLLAARMEELVISLKEHLNLKFNIYYTRVLELENTVSRSSVL